MARSSFTTGVLIVFFCTQAATAGALTFVVDRTDDPDPATAQTCSSAPNDCSLRGAVVKANASPDDDEILLSSGHYLLTRPGGFEDDSLLGDLDLKTNITLTGDGAATTIIDGGQILMDRVLHINPVGASGIVVINDVAITGGKTSYTVFSSSPGGGVLVEGLGPVTLNRVDVRGNASSDGGPGFLGGTSSASMGGGVFVQGTPALAINESRIRDNVTGNGVQLPPTPGASNGGDGGGLGVAVSGGTVTVQNSEITGNRTGDGGNGGSLGGNGGRGGDGGGVFAYLGGLVLKNVTIAGNRTGKGGDGGAGDTATPGGNGAPGGGGAGIDALAATVSANNVTIAFNETGAGGAAGTGTPAGSPGTKGPGGGVRVETISGAVVNAGNSILAENLGTGPNCAGEMNTNGFNLIDNNDGCLLIAMTGTVGDQIGTAAAPIDALLDPAGLADNGGASFTIALLAASPAKDAGDDATCEPTDQRATERPQGAHCDKGAYEKGACGDGHAEPDEDCDDGNLTDGDGCSAICETEPPATTGGDTGGGASGTGGGDESGGGCHLIRR